MKPTIFFSHSSLDGERIKPIKEYLTKNTGNTIQIFMSSDGASIPFGNNWLKEIEDALAICKLMFVWITPNSANSKWVYFESGFAYSRSLKVVPIGFDGFKLEDLPAPLNLLQGFNINSASGLNNIIEVINSEFDLTFPNFFDNDFYENIVIKSSIENSSELLEYVNSIKCTFYPKIKMDDESSFELKQNWHQIFLEVLKAKEESFTQEKVNIYGVGYKIYPSKEANPYPEIYIDPLSLNNVWNILKDLSLKTYEQKIKNLALAIHLESKYILPDDHFLISSRLVNTEVDLDTSHPNLLYKFRNILFRINIWDDNRPRKTIKRKELVIIVDQDEQDPIPLLSLIKLLEKQYVIKKDNQANAADAKSRAAD